MSKQCFSTTAGASLLALLLAGCSQPVRVDSDWQGTPLAAPLDEVLVVGVGPDLNGRRTFEDLVVDRLASSGNRAWASSRKMDTSAPPQRDTVAQAVTDTGANLVVVVRLVSQETSIGKTGERPDMKMQRKSDTPLDFFRYDYEEIEASTYLVPNSAVRLTADVYGVERGTLLYTIEVVIPPRDTRLEIMNDAARAIVDRLRRDRLVR